MSTKPHLQNIFAKEMAVLESGKEVIKNCPDQHELLVKYKELLGQYEKLLKISKKIFTISDIQGRVLKQRETEIEKISYHDSLTKLYNRAYVDNVVGQLMEPANYPISLIMGDINGLKLINDVFGHEKGDQLIILAAKVLQHCCRHRDLVARWGGDEFLILLPNTNQEHCEKVVERIKLACAEERLGPIEISLAMGSTTLESPERSYVDAFSEAEMRMYKKKLQESQDIRQKIVKDLENKLATSSSTIPGHIQRLKQLGIQFAGVLGIAQDSTDLKNLLLLISLHDTGNLVLPTAAQIDQANLIDDVDRTLLRTHNEIGYRTAVALGETQVAEAILALQEHWDGTGTPNGLQGKRIPLISRMLAIMDTFDLLTHAQENPINSEKALQKITAQSGHQFDPDLVRVFNALNL